MKIFFLTLDLEVVLFSQELNFPILIRHFFFESKKLFY